MAAMQADDVSVPFVVLTTIGRNLRIATTTVAQQASHPLRGALATTCTCARLRELLIKFSKSGRAIAIDFRQESRSLQKIDRGRHFLHPYPAKMLAEIPHFFLSNSILSVPGDEVLDPFCGTGTVLLEAARLGRTPIGADSNPLARLITRVKLTSIPGAKIHKALERIKRVTSTIVPTDAPDVVNIDHWFHPHIQRQLQQLSMAIARTRDARVRDFFQVCFSHCVKDVSNADPRLSVPVVLRHDQYPPNHPLLAKTQKRITRLRRINVLKRFIEITEHNARFVVDPLGSPANRALIVLQDAKTLADELEKNSVQLILTSPPYLGVSEVHPGVQPQPGMAEACARGPIEGPRSNQYRT